MNISDIREGLRIKNYELYLSNLDNIIDSNYALIKASTKKIINEAMHDMVIEIMNIECSFSNQSLIEYFINEFFHGFYQFIMKSYNDYFQILRTNKSGNLFINKVDSDIINAFKDYYSKYINVIINGISMDYCTRELEILNNYLLHVYYEQIINNLKNMFSNANIILITNYWECKNRLKIINEKTLKQAF